MPAQSKLTYKIVGRRPQDPEIEMVDVEWSHSTAKIVPDGRSFPIKDQINVPPGTSDEFVARVLEGKRDRLAKNLGVDP